MVTLRYGDRGTLVQYLQLALKRAGYTMGMDGVFGAGTRAAVVRFQQERGLTPDGIVGNQTWAALIPYLKGYTVHTLRRGDTFWQLAQLYQTELQRILTANPMVNPEQLPIGSNVVIPFGFDLVPEQVSYSSLLNDWIIEGLVVRYPFLRMGEIGKSVMGKNLSYLQIGTGSKQVFYNASHHANEWLTTPVLLKFAEEYCQAFVGGGKIFDMQASTLFYGYQLFLVPMVNPDGVDLVTGVLSSGTAYQKAVRIAQNYRNIPFPNGWKANISGVDLNLQYPANWEEAKKIKYEQGVTSPAPRDFVGAAPLSEPESNAVYRFTRSHNFLLTLSYHSQGKLIYWKYLNYEPEWSREIADYFGEVSGYTVEETPYASGFAGYKDWFIETYDRPGYTIEVGIGKSPLPIRQFAEIYEANRGILVGGMSQI